MRRHLGMFTLLVGASLFCPLPVQAGPYAPKVGQRHEEFTLPSIAEGQPVSLAQFRGKKVLLIQFASW